MALLTRIVNSSSVPELFSEAMESGMEAVKALSLREKLQASYSGDED